MTIFITLNEDNQPDTWGIIELPGAIAFNVSELPAAYDTEFAQKLWKIIDGKFVQSIPQEVIE